MNILLVGMNGHMGREVMKLAETRGVNEYIVLIVTMLANFVLEFLFCKFVVYRGKEDTLESTKTGEA